VFICSVARLYVQSSMSVVALLLVTYNKEFAPCISATLCCPANRLVFAFPPKTAAYRALYTTVSCSGVLAVGFLPLAWRLRFTRQITVSEKLYCSDLSRHMHQAFIAVGNFYMCCCCCCICVFFVLHCIVVVSL